MAINLQEKLAIVLKSKKEIELLYQRALGQEQLILELIKEQEEDNKQD